ncbi:MAG: heterodisulfide reductase-related iron-sulfur binding cluster [Gammaproteobacteria bacterium]|nr:heterodisulfide reductase-related iron-sulfur binding cluster [Gammaproteobacteria bacterium]
MSERREGNLDAPIRHPIKWKEPEYWDEGKLYDELERVFDICHGCRRCVSLCQSFPTMFDLIDESETMEVDGVDKADYMKVVEECYLCDLCYMTKCPYVPPHEWNVDFPHLMLQAKAQKFKKQGASFRDKTLTSTDAIGKMASIPVVDLTVNALNRNGLFRGALESTFGVHHEAPVPEYHSQTLRKQFKSGGVTEPKAAGRTTGKVALFSTCYCNYTSPQIGEDFVTVFEHNGIQIDLVPQEVCCGMPKLELGDFDTVEGLKEKNISQLAKMVDDGYDIVAPIPSCVLMFKQELPLMYPEDDDVKKVQKAFFDPFEYLFLRHKEGLLDTEFSTSLGDVSYQVACHTRVQNVGMKTRDVLNLVPDTQVHAIERCSGHDGTYAVKKETRAHSVKIARPVVRQVDQKAPDHFSSDCPMAATQIAHLSESVEEAEHPISLLRKAYGL